MLTHNSKQHRTNTRIAVGKKNVYIFTNEYFQKKHNELFLNLSDPRFAFQVARISLNHRFLRADDLWYGNAQHRHDKAIRHSQRGHKSYLQKVLIKLFIY